jgi:hypothetical protein
MAAPQTKAELAEFLGLPVNDARLDDLFLNYTEIADAIRQLRKVDLGETLPAVIFAPTCSRTR